MGLYVLLTPSRRLKSPTLFSVLASGGFLWPIGLPLLNLDLDAFMLNVQTKACVDAHILIGNPNQSKEADQVTPPIEQQ